MAKTKEKKTKQQKAKEAASHHAKAKSQTDRSSRDALANRNVNQTQISDEQPQSQSSTDPSTGDIEQPEDNQAVIAAMKAELEQLRAQVQSQGKQAKRKIPKPEGECGRDYSLKEEMELDDDEEKYKAIRHTVRDLVHHSGMQRGVTYIKQDKEKVLGVILQARKDEPYLDEFEGDWAIIDIIKGVLHNFTHGKTKAPTSKNHRNRILRRSHADSANSDSRLDTDSATGQPDDL
ncbi:hypothetical protein M422DRAFT_253246 [Sphaerobolus stellatus SS14]|uniref:Uncharacterized protein n=1 Tax=Sphaerobolus stellatus (strain SS14) TaxID=990650 RepID=A0A0C9VY33_SPHS4|nr:hypothetical protein M422DRAFT_253246 [Sphaerobolus stellatus SS14]